eukprot:5313758-Amphidinium_carterae.1
MLPDQKLCTRAEHFNLPQSRGSYGRASAASKGLVCSRFVDQVIHVVIPVGAIVDDDIGENSMVPLWHDIQTQQAIRSRTKRLPSDVGLILSKFRLPAREISR